MKREKRSTSQDLVSDKIEKKGEHSYRIKALPMPDFESIKPKTCVKKSTQPL